MEILEKTRILVAFIIRFFFWVKSSLNEIVKNIKSFEISFYLALPKDPTMIFRGQYNMVKVLLKIK